MKYLTSDPAAGRRGTASGGRHCRSWPIPLRHAVPVMLLAVVLGLLPAIGHTDGHKDHDRARKALLSGEVLSLRQVLDIVAREYPGEPVEIEFERDDEVYVYEIKLLQPSGSILKMKVDAANGKVIKVKGRDIERRGD